MPVGIQVQTLCRTRQNNKFPNNGANFMNSKKRVILSKRNVIYLFIGLAILFTTAGFFYYQSQRTILKAQIYQELSGIAKIKITDLEHWLDDRKIDAQFLFENQDFKNDLEIYIKDPLKKNNSGKINFWFKTINGDKEYRNYIIIDSSGKLIYSQRKPRIPLYKNTVEEAKEALRENKVVMSDLKLDTLTKSIYMQAYIPILNNYKNVEKVLGIVILRINPFDSFYPTIQAWPLPTKTAESYLIRIEGDSILYLSNLKYVKNAAMNYKQTLQLEYFPANNVDKIIEGIFEGKDYRRVHVLADLKKIQGTNWFMITKIDLSEIYKPISKEARLVGLVITFLIILSAVLLYFIWKLQKQNFDKMHYNELLEKKRLREQLNIIIQDANDIFMLMDANRNIIDVNETAIKTYGYTRKEFLKLKAEDLRVPEYKDKLFEDFKRLESEKKVFIETYHVRKNGEIFPIEVGITLVTLESEKVIQAIIRDVTERKNYEKNLIKLNRVYAVLSNINQLIVREKDKQKIFDYACKIAVDDGKFKIAWIGLVVEGTQKLKIISSYGADKEYKDFIHNTLNVVSQNSKPSIRCIKEGIHIINNNIENDFRDFQANEKVIQNNILSSAVFPLKINDQTIGVLSLYTDEKEFFSNDEIRLLDEMASDISFAIEFLESEEQRQKAEELLSDSQKRYKDLFESNPNPMWIYEVETLKFVDVNKMAVNHYGYSKEEFLSMTLKDIRPDEDIRSLLDNVKSSVTEVQNSGIWRHKKKNGEIIFVEIKSNTLSIPGYSNIRVVLVNDVTEKLKAEQAIREAEERYRSTLDNMLEGCQIIDFNFRYLYLNDVAAMQGKHTKEEFLGRTMMEIYPGIEKTEMFNLLKRCIEDRALYSIENEFVYPDGTKSWFYLKMEPIPEGVFIISDDITKQKEAQGKIIKSEAQFRSVWQNSADGMRLTDAEGNIVMVNEAFCRMIEMDKNHLEGKSLSVIYKPGNQNHVTQKHKERFASKTVESHFEREMILWNNKKIWLEVTNSFIEIGEKETLLLGIFRDITSRKQAEEKIKLLAYAVEGVSECVSITDQEDKIIFVNKSFLEKYGYKEEELIGKDVSILRPENIALDAAKEILPETIKGGWQGEIINRKKDGTEFPVYLSTSVIKDEKDNPIALVGVATDITESKRAREELIAAKEKAEEMNQIKSNFLANMSHELRTPMIGILGFSELLKSEIVDPGHKNMAETIYLSGKRLLDTLNLLLDLARLESNKQEIIFKEINIGQFVKETLKNFEGYASSKNLFLKTFIKKDVYSSLDERMLLQILNNLINNALKFTEHGGVTVEVDSEKINNQNWSVMKVIDSGIGIPKDSLNIIFEEFRQVSEGYNRIYEGTGLGLTITKRSVELMNGNISVESDLGSGTTFIVKFPLSQSNDSIEQISDDTNESILIEKETSTKILVVDNDATTLTYVNFILNKYFTIHTAEDGETAIKLASENSYNLILMDIGLGKGINGIEATQEIRKIPGYEKTPIVAVTAFAMKDDKNVFLSKGLSHYISKPFSKFDLLNLVNKILSIQK